MGTDSIKPMSTMMAKHRFPAIWGRMTASRLSQRFPLLAMPQAASMRNTGMMVENTGNIMPAMMRLRHSPRSRKRKRTIP